MTYIYITIIPEFLGIPCHPPPPKRAVVSQVPSVPYGASDALTAPWRLQMPRLQQILAARRQLLLATREEVLLLEVPSGQLRHVSWCLGGIPSGFSIVSLPEGMGWGKVGALEAAKRG